jgi:hypothetical protein
LLAKDADEVSFLGTTDLVFRQLAEKANYLARIHTDGTGLERILEVPISAKDAASPDGAWVIASGLIGPDASKGTYAFSLRDGSRRAICEGPCVVRWSVDGKYLFVTLSHSPSDEKNTTSSSGRTLVISLSKGLEDSAIPAGGFPAAVEQPPAGIQVIQQWLVAPRFDASSYAYEAPEFQGNLFRIPLH